MHAHPCYSMCLFGRECSVREDVLQQPSIVPPSPILPSFLIPRVCTANRDRFLLYLEMTCGVIGDDDWPGEK